MREIPSLTRLHKCRLLCWINPTRFEQACSRVVLWADRRGIGWLGDLADRAGTRSCHVRAAIRYRREQIGLHALRFRAWLERKGYRS